MIQSVENVLPLVALRRAFLLGALAVLSSGVAPSLVEGQAGAARTGSGVPVGDAMTVAKATDGRFISWRAAERRSNTAFAISTPARFSRSSSTSRLITRSLVMSSSE